MSDAIILTINQPHQISSEQIGHLLTSALEGGSNYWMSWDYSSKYKKWVNMTLPLHTVNFEGTFFTFPQYLIQHDAYGLTIRESDGVKHNLTLNKMKKGLKIMASNYPKHFHNFITGNEDAQTGDVFLQCCVLKKVIYG